MFVSTFRYVDHLASLESKFSPHQQESSQHRNTSPPWGLCWGGPETEQFVDVTVGTLTRDTNEVLFKTYFTCFTPFSFNAPCQFTPLLNLRSLVFGLKPFGSLRSVTVTPYLSFSIYALYNTNSSQIKCALITGCVDGSCLSYI
jgi:hypothetical protein